MSEVVLFDEAATTSGHRIGIVTLNAPASLNALSLPMVRLMLPRLQSWAQDADICAVVLQATGDKAFCAGGDLRELYQSMREYGPRPNPYAQEFFGQEYRLDHLIHTYPKPFVCWGHGIVMGGGIGLMCGASHRVVTPASRLAMPEIGIGLYPDVGGSWFLNRMPGRIGLFLALTGAQLNAGDALFGGLADVCIEPQRRLELFDDLTQLHWSADAQRDSAAVSRLLARLAQNCALPPSRLRQHYDAIDQLMSEPTLPEIAARLRALNTDDSWLAGAAANFAKGSPTSAMLAHALWRRVARLSLADVFRLEYQVSLGCCAHGEFTEGIRALLIDKDRQPRWNPATLEGVTPDLLNDHFMPRHAGAHPLADLR
ncbi:MAG: enoyl-CoA hydratase/isomerase family protein [Burkholderiaceae bacterium]|nr:enoyl-CoA hydratase/isomerase family protein [Burkholderiaceae bacterium]